MSVDISRTQLRMRMLTHTGRSRAGEIVVDVVRDGKVIANIYGSREGVHIVSGHFRDPRHNNPFHLDVSAAPIPGWVVPILRAGEVCPWCGGHGEFAAGMVCPVCYVVPSPGDGNGNGNGNNGGRG